MAGKTVPPAVVERVIERDGGRCARCGRAVAHLVRGIAWSLHHRRPRGAGGTTLAWVNLPANLVILCGSGVTECHGWVEKHRDKARELGFLVRLSGLLIAADVAIEHAVHGLVRLDDEGDYRKEARCLATSGSS